MKNVCYLDKIQNNNLFEEYCAVLPRFLGRSVKYYSLNTRGEAVIADRRKESTVKKILILLSHMTLIVPAAMYAGKAINRLIRPAKISTLPPNLENFDEEQAKKDYIEIRRLREDSSYIPNECKQLRFPLRLWLPIDRILNLPFENLLCLYAFSPLDRELAAKQEQILANDFNGFRCVHGVEAAKGGRRNILNMMLEGVVRAPYTGGLLDGPPDFCAGPHGPYYVILDPNYSNQASKRKGLWAEKAQVAFLVPSADDREYLVQGLSKACEKKYITEGEKKRALRKVITYDEFIALPKNVRHREKKLAAWLKNHH
jgi:hypothetical protein